MVMKIPLPGWVALSAGLLLLASVLSFPGAFGLATNSPLVGITSAGGMALSAELPTGVTRPRPRQFLFPDYPVLLEDGRVLARPMSSSKQILNAGRGRYKVSGSSVQFSTSDGGPVSGRAYEIRSPRWSLPEFLLMAIWLAGLTVSAITARLLVGRQEVREAANKVLLPGVPAIAAGFVVLFFCFRETASDRFFLGLLVPAAWAVLMGALALQRSLAARIGLFVLAVVPAFAGFSYFGLNAASNSFCLVAGVIPHSDAWVHFQQAAEIALQGTTQTLFNGRFLYPAFFAVFLNAAGLNVLLAHLLVSCLVMTGLALTVPLVADRLGAPGAAIYCLLFWLYFRVHGCGLVMTETLGLLLGVVGFGFLLASVSLRRIWPVFAAIFFVGLGSATRPGALFILPALALYAGLRTWHTGGDHAGKRVASAMCAILLGLLLAAACFGTNQLLMRMLHRGDNAKPFGNFAFTLHGLVNNTKWSTSAEATDSNAALVMEQTIKQIKESPGSLIQGIFRAYGEAMDKGFLFRFGSEKRFASGGTLLFLLAALACWFWAPLRADAGWILPAVAGILASIPFAPPWDAGERPYAATEPIQIFLAAAGAVLAFHLLGRFASRVVRTDPGAAPHGAVNAGIAEPVLPEKKIPGLIGFSALCFFLVVPLPALLKLAGYKHPALSQTDLPGSRIFVSEDPAPRKGAISRARYLDRLSDFQAEYPDQAGFFTAGQGDFKLAINWQSLQVVLTPLTPLDKERTGRESLNP